MLSKHLRKGVSGLSRAALTGLALLFILPAPAALADADNAGNVIAARRDAWAERGRAKPQLYSKSPIFTGDRLTTNPVGRLQVLFNDDSVLMLAPDSQATITEYVYAGESGNSFNINLAKGVTKLISGRMVENEPGSMRVETPEITVGIQGTAVAVQSDGGISKVTVLHATPGKPTIVYCGEDQRKTYLETSGTVLIMNAEERCVPQIRRITADEQFFLQSLSLPLSGPALSTTTAPTGPGQTPPSQPILVAQLPPSTDPGGSGQLTPPLSNITNTSFNGTYVGPMTGSSDGGSWSGTMTLGIADLSGAPTVTLFEANAMGPVEDIDYFSVYSTPNAQLSPNGEFSFSTNPGEAMLATGGMIHSSTATMDVTNGGVFGDHAGFNWEVKESGNPIGSTGLTGTGSGIKQ